MTRGLAFFIVHNLLNVRYRTQFVEFTIFCFSTRCSSSVLRDLLNAQGKQLFDCRLISLIPPSSELFLILQKSLQEQGKLLFD